MIGQTRYLWKTEYSSQAYRDQFDIAHPGYIVEYEVKVKIIEEKSVQGEYNGDAYIGYRAVDDQGRSFYLHWDSYPDACTSNPDFYWDARKDELGFWQPQDAVASLNWGHGGIAFVNQPNRDGDISFCEKHHQYNYVTKECFYCENNFGKRLS